MLNTYNHIRFRILVQCKGSEIKYHSLFYKTNLPALPIEYINEKIATIKNCGGVFVVSAALTGAWNLWFSSTQVGFVNYQVINLGQISKANHNSFD